MSRRAKAEAVIATMEEEASRLRQAGRGAVGVVGRFELGPMADALRASGLSWYPLAALAALGGVDALFLVTLANSAGPISASLGVTNLTLLLYIRLVAVLVLALVAFRVTRHGVHRRAVALGGGALCVIALIVAGFARNSWAFAAAALVAGLGSGAAQAVHRPLVFDHYRPEVRVRAMAVYGAGVMVAAAAASAVTPVADAVGLSWRSVFAILACAAALAVVISARLGDVAQGRWETRAISGLVERRLGAVGPERNGTGSEGESLTASQRLRQVVTAPAARPLLFTAAASGIFLVTVPTYLLTFWRTHWHMGPDADVGLYAGLCLASLAGLTWFGRRGELAFRATPARMLRLTSRVLWLAAVSLPLAVGIRSFAVMVVLLAVAFGALAVVLPAVSVALLAIVRPGNRPHASLALGLVVVQGGLSGTLLVQAFVTRYGLKWGFVVVALVLVACAGAAARAARSVDADLDETVASMIEARELRTLVSQGKHLPLLAVHRVEFAYGPVQVLFDVDFTVDEGEMVALLGTNGAGKSTLLRLISGVSMPTRGSVHFCGAEITHVGPDERVRLGISQVPGGRAVFGTLTVAENLRVFGYTRGRDRRAVEAGVEAGLAAFPPLAARAGQLAATLSGGEQQMLGIAKAFVVPPRLLLIDELSLGLAPRVVGELLDTVRQLHAEGTAIVVVEQSVNIALALVDHAYFMEKGEIRFDGRADELARRPDLVRSVFLQGVARTMA